MLMRVGLRHGRALTFEKSRAFRSCYMDSIEWNACACDFWIFCSDGGLYSVNLINAMGLRWQVFTHDMTQWLSVLTKELLSSMKRMLLEMCSNRSVRILPESTVREIALYAYAAVFVVFDCGYECGFDWAAATFEDSRFRSMVASGMFLW